MNMDSVGRDCVLCVHWASLRWVLIGLQSHMCCHLGLLASSSKDLMVILLARIVIGNLSFLSASKFGFQEKVQYLFTLSVVVKGLMEYYCGMVCVEYF